MVQPTETMFLFSVYTFIMGRTEKRQEKELLTIQHRKNVRFYQCNSSVGYSDVTSSRGNGFSTVQDDDVKRLLHGNENAGVWNNEDEVDID